MSEVEKLYENAGIKLGCCKYAEYGYEGEEGTWYYCKKENKECWTYPNGNANCVEKGYPPFTAERQIELIKWLVKNQDIFKITYHREFLWCSSIEWVESDCYEEFEESLADLINTIWQDLTEEEKQQIKEILE
jgi:hypothetical protein